MGWSRGKKKIAYKNKAGPFTKCGQEVNFTLQLKEDEQSPGRQQSGWVADVLLCLSETHVSKWGQEHATPLRYKAARKPVRRKQRQKKNCQKNCLLRKRN